MSVGFLTVGMVVLLSVSIILRPASFDKLERLAHAKFLFALMNRIRLGLHFRLSNMIGSTDAYCAYPKAASVGMKRRNGIDISNSDLLVAF